MLAVWLVLSCAIGARAQDIEANGIYYNIINETQVEVTAGPGGYHGCVIIPEHVHCDGVKYEVAAIAPRAFWQSAVTRVQIPNTVTVIGEAAFADAEDLANVTLPLGLTAVSRYMLAGTAVTHVVLPEGVTDIDRGAFEDCSRLTTVFLPASLRRIGDRAFGYCVNLKEVYSDAYEPPLLMGDDTFEDVGPIHVMLPDGAAVRHYQNDGHWGDEDQFTLWLDEGLVRVPMMGQEAAGKNWTAITLEGGFAYKIYGPDGYLTAITAADRYFLPLGAVGEDYLVVPTTLMRDEEDMQLVATTADPAAVEPIEEDLGRDLTIVGLDGTIYILGDTHGLWTFIYDVYGNLWYERPAVNNWISLPGPRVYIVKVGDTVRKVMLN